MIAQAIAGEIDAAFFSIKCSDILSKWVGEAEQNIKELFKEASKYERAIIFLMNLMRLQQEEDQQIHLLCLE